MTVEERFWSKVDKSGECWVWLGSKNSYGYGTFNVGKQPNGKFRYVIAPRLAWELTYGVEPKEQAVCHRCDNPACVRPDHLFLGSQKDNMIDAARKGRSTHGSRNPRAKLTEDQVRAIRTLRAGGIRINEICKRYSIHRMTVRLIVQGKTWTRI